MSRMTCFAWFAAIAAGVLLLSPVAEGAKLRGRIVRVGYAGSGAKEEEQGIDRFRAGYFTPVLIELTNDEGDAFTGSIEVRQPDRDGDLVIARREVMVSGTRRFYLYVPASDSNSPQQFAVRAVSPEGGLVVLHDDAGQPVRELVSPVTPAQIESDARVILDISTVNLLRDLIGKKRLNRPVEVLRVAARDLPEDPAGLEMIDTVVWDGGDPEVMDLQQREALLEWVRRGGHLVIGVSRNWQQLSKSKFGEFLPMELTEAGPLAALDPSWQADLEVGVNFAFTTPLSHCPVKPAGLRPGAVPIIPRMPGAQTPVLAAYRPLERGHVVLIGAELRELLDPRRGNSVPVELILRKIVGLRDEPIRSDQDQFDAFRSDLFPYIERRTGFQVTTQLYLLIAFVFVASYVLLATGGSWLWLKKRNRVHHAWGAFAAVVLVASVTSLGAVHLIRGVGHRVQELALVDVEAGSSDATALCYFGLKTAVHTNLDLHLATRGATVEEMPERSTMLKPLPVDTNPMALGGGRYSAGQRYEAVAALGELRNVPLRATLKQLEGFWRGRIGGKLDASLRRTNKGIHVDSWLANNLDTDLKNCYLLFPAQTCDWPRTNLRAIRCYTIGDLPKGKRLRLGDLEDVAKQEEINRRIDLPEATSRWTRNFRRNTQDDDYYGIDRETAKKIDLGELNNVLMTLTVFDEIERDQRSQLGRSQGQQLDRSLAINRRTAMLVGFSDSPGPAWLCWRTPGEIDDKWRPIPSDDDRRVVYRVTIPVEE